MAEKSVRSPLGDRLKKALNMAGISIKDASAKIGVPERAFYNWTRGLREPKIEVLERITKELGINPSYLLTGQGPPLVRCFGDGVFEIGKKKLQKKMKFIGKPTAISCGSWSMCLRAGRLSPRLRVRSS